MSWRPLPLPVAAPDGSDVGVLPRPAQIDDTPAAALSPRRAANTEAEGAILAYEAVLERAPAQLDALLGLARLLLVRGEAARAQSLLLRCCGLAPGLAGAWDALGVSLMLTGDAAAAESAFAEAARHDPAAIDIALRRVDAAVAAGRAEAEHARLDVACARDPLDIPALAARGAILAALGRPAEAVDALDVACILAPAAAEPAVLLGRVLATLNRPRQAETALRRAIALAPDDIQPRNDLATVLMRLHRHAAAAAILRDLLAEQGRVPALLANLASATVALGEHDAALALAEEAVALAPDAYPPRRALCNLLPYHPATTGTGLLTALRDAVAGLPRAEARPWDNMPERGRRLRVGLLSGLLRNHPVGWLTIAGFEALDSREFELVCLAQHGGDDALARRFRALASAWHAVEGRDDAALAALARSLGIDILIDLGGHGDAGRVAACARRLAPVQIKWVGMQNHSSGLPEMDWFITDRWETPPGFEPLYTERLLRLPDGYVCYSPPPHAPDVTALPALRRGAITFGCFNNLIKLTEPTIAAWARILAAQPEARLLLKAHQYAEAETAERLRRRFAAHGAPPARIELRGASGHRQFLAEMGECDLMLDPFPYTGGLTTCEALWMGVPTVTLAGEIFAARHSLSHLSNAGLGDWAAADVDAYVALALAKARDVAGLAALRDGLRARVKASPLCDAPRFGRGLGAALRHAWEDWCATGVRAG
jgi:predicted O-linked N-acetylglucosamine transferase (SPINDLY family)